ncbi:zinc ABC transporter substrate-binding protein [Oceaniovalibus sp. ACAM 378]|uniref:zinc ABC transporter substrate-binding protein n=1 Tax=Oceaniovalibus sp. ACAM 378 TaxID=2599923 RepID=UPI0011D7F92D|nr:zinc ABC transporter substrate-binding protein [Oceaniovalibus sp. ACAM 378]TYB90077.1 zinc transporter [Oceaniovalibus sp. ACAM 378]
MFNPRAAALCALLFATPAMADVPRVVTDIAPVHGLVSKVMQGLGTPHLIVRPGASPHDHDLRPSDAGALQSADAVFWIGTALTPQLESRIETLAGSAVSVQLLNLPGTETLAFRLGATFGPDDHGHDADTPAPGTAPDHDHDHDHDQSGTDPHAFLSPDNARLWLGEIASTLSGLDPENAAIYVANAAAGQAEIDTVVAEIEPTLAALSDVRYVVFHDAYQYFERRFGLAPIGAINLSDASDPSPTRLDAMRAATKGQNVVCAFSEPQFNPGLIAAVFGGTDTKTAVLDPLGTAIPIGPGFYPALLRDLAQGMADCL